MHMSTVTKTKSIILVGNMKTRERGWSDGEPRFRLGWARGKIEIYCLESAIKSTMKLTSSGCDH